MLVTECIERKMREKVEFELMDLGCARNLVGLK